MTTITIIVPDWIGWAIVVFCALVATGAILDVMHTVLRHRIERRTQEAIKKAASEAARTIVSAKLDRRAP